MDFATGTAGNTISSAILVPLIQQIIQQIDDAIRLDENRELLEEQLDHMRDLLIDINSLFQDQQRETLVSLQNCLLRMQRKVGEARELIHRSQRPWLEQCIDCLLCKPNASTQIREWNTTILQLYDQLRNVFSLIGSAQQIVSAAPQQADALLQDESDTGFIGKDIEAAETQLQRWVLEAHHVRIIAIYGMGGVGKTTLLKKVYNTFKVSNHFDDVIWDTVAQFSIEQMQNDIASTIHLDVANCSADMRKMKLSAYMKTKKFLLVLDDMWSAVDLKELGVEFGEKRGSKVVFTTRNRDLVQEMKAKESMQIKTLPTEEAWELFCKVAFEDGPVPQDIEHTARQVAEECKGLPLAIKVIAAAMNGNTTVDQWKLALKQMQKVDLNFPLTHPRIDRDLYQRLRWSYDSLPHAHLKSCFLYCAMFQEDARIGVEYLVRIWIAEGLVKTNEDAEYEYILKTGESYVKLLENRCLLQVEGGGFNVHDVVRDMAIYIGENEENCVMRAGQSLQHFPDIKDPHNCKRISVSGNDFTSLSAAELKCPKLVCLLLERNYQLKDIPQAFFLNFPSLRVLDLFEISMKSLPTSLWQLTQLEWLTLDLSEINEISEDIGNLSHLQFLRLWHCQKLKSLPSQMGELKNLKHLEMWPCPPTLVTDNLRRKLPNCKIVMH